MAENVSYYTKVEGVIQIAPAIPWSQFRDLESTLTDATFVMNVENIETDDGTLTRKSAVGVRAKDPDDQVSRYNLENELQIIAERFGGEHEFSEYLEETSCEHDGQVWRYYVRGVKLIKVVPAIIWPTVNAIGDLAYELPPTFTGMIDR